ncbi:chitinase [Streptomyces echinatus]
MPRTRTLSASTALAVTALTLSTGLFTASPAQAATGTVTGLAGKCLDVAGAASADGTPVQLYDCNGTNAQQWTVGSDGTIRALGKCLDVTGNSTADGAKAQLWTCTGGANQKWTVTAAHDIVNPQANKCLDVTGNDSANGTRTQIWSCGGGANQKWNAPAAGGGTPSAPMAVAPYLYNGWGSPPSPSTITQATGVKWFTLAFVLSNGYCNPQWDGSRPLTGGVDQRTVDTVRGNGGDVIPSFGGYSGQQAGELLLQRRRAGGRLPEGHQRLRPEGDRHRSGGRRLQQRHRPAAHGRRAEDREGRQPGAEGVHHHRHRAERTRHQLINRAAASGLSVDAWAIMPFDFGGAGRNMGSLTVQAAEGLKNALKNAYRYSDDQAYRDMGISSMNGITDQNETVTVADFRTILAYAQQHHLARLTFWSANRDRPCTGGPADSCSGVGQSDWDYTRVFAGYTG